MENSFEQRIVLAANLRNVALKCIKSDNAGSLKEIPGYPGYIVTPENPSTDEGLILLDTVKNESGDNYYICQITEAGGS